MTNDKITLAERYRRWADRNRRTANGLFFYDDGTVERGRKQPRSRVIDVLWMDGRHHQGTSGRGRAAIATGGLSLAASGTAGYVGVTVVTEAWVDTVTSKENLSRLYDLAAQAKAVAG